MDDLRLSAVADRVVAWHNRHPLARRISAAQVHAIGYMALPFTAEAPPPSTPSAAQAAAQAIAAAAAAPLPVLNEAAAVSGTAGTAGTDPQNPPEGSRLRERALARAREQAGASGLHAASSAHDADTAAALLATVAPATLKRNFSEHFIDTLTARQVARFALKHGRVLARAPNDGPVREVPADAGLPEGRQPERRQRLPAQVYVLTAVIETDTRKSRVLVGSGSAVLGRRIHSSPRTAAMAALAAGVVATPLWLMQAPTGLAGLTGLTGPVQSAAAVPAPAVAVAVAVAPEVASNVAASPPLPAADTPAPVPFIPPAPAPPSVAENSARRKPVSILPLLTDEQKALAREQRQALLEAAAAAVPAAATRLVPLPAPLAAPATSAASAALAAPAATPLAALAGSAGPVFAISTRALRTRAEADQVRVAMKALLQVPGQAEVQVDVLPQGDDWRVVALPFLQRADAEKGRALLASRGMRVAVVDF